MAAQVDDHQSEAGPKLVESFALLWPRAVQGRGRRARSGVPGHLDLPMEPR